MRVACGSPLVLSLQYGIVLYQNYKVPQQRKTLLSHFSAPVVGFRHLASQTCSAARLTAPSAVMRLCLPLEERFREFPGGDGFLRENRPSDRQPRGSAERCHGGGTRVEGETRFCQQQTRALVETMNKSCAVVSVSEEESTNERLGLPQSTAPLLTKFR